MDILRIPESIDYRINNHKVEFVDNENFKYISYRKTVALEWILSKINKGILYEDLINIAMKDNQKLSHITKLINNLVELNIIKKSTFSDDLVNNIALKEVELLEEIYDYRHATEIYFLERYETNDTDRFDYYEKLKNSNICIIGMGAVGSHIAVIAAASGIKNITLVDGDIIDESNLVRQIYYKENDVGRKKVDVMKEYINGLDSDINVKISDVYILTKKDAEEIIKDKYDIVVQTADFPRGVIDYVVSLACIKYNVSLIFTHSQLIGPLYIPQKSGCYFCMEYYLNKTSDNLYKKIQEISEKGNSRKRESEPCGAYICGSILFDEIRKYLLGIDNLKCVNTILKINEGEIISNTFFPINEQCICQLNKND